MNGAMVNVAPFVGHGTEWRTHSAGLDESGGVEFFALRNPKWIFQFASLAATYLLEAIIIMLNHFRSEELTSSSFARYFNAEVDSMFTVLQSRRLNVYR